mmetsp:Transcript_9213/g.19972  ORF Transcript_9213/g.19972 Transcript_9213/m.19972 type:complete len:236 (-) Transcript_9213:240-947(-)|eukprot:CAMPEP_0168185638 /NCGR_PEP_ID=MMETSP0139_2-20121125/13961_1 /TAXON_ID=44445 /ORGANISM="Pseudo-nitzschia australis, Strain 10249 10 AB" /LENGTH=235 /DNA_ID=CAMNT_0008107503 /DNA_START=46 /DNA_END=753 /DNA_ORIENTATION=-
MAPPFYRLYTPPASFFAFAPLIVAEYVGVLVEVETVTTESVELEQLVASKSPTGKSPILETQNGEIVCVSSQAISRFIAGLRRDTPYLLGSTSLRESLAIEDWTNWASQELELPACVCYYNATGCIPLNEETFTKGKKDVACALDVLESHLRKGSSSNNKRKIPQTMSTYLVNPERVTLADIVVTCILVYPFTLVFDKADLESYPNVVLWFQNCMKEPEFVTVLGKIKCGREVNT